MYILIDIRYILWKYISIKMMIEDGILSLAKQPEML